MTPAQISARAKAKAKYDKKCPPVSFRLAQTEAEQLEIIREAKEKLNEAARRVFRVGLETMKGNSDE